MHELCLRSARNKDGCRRCVRVCVWRYIRWCTAASGRAVETVDEITAVLCRLKLYRRTVPNASNAVVRADSGTRTSRPYQVLLKDDPATRFIRAIASGRTQNGV